MKLKTFGLGLFLGLSASVAVPASAASALSPVDICVRTQKTLLDSLSSQRILIFGIPGGGKTTISTAIKTHRDIIGAPVDLFHLDKIKFVENAVFKKRNIKEARSQIMEWASNPSWIIEGDILNSRTLGGRAETVKAKFFLELAKMVDTIVFVSDAGRPEYTEACRQRAIARPKKPKDPRIDDKPKGCPEGCSDNLLKIIDSYHENTTGLVEALIDDVMTSETPKRFIELGLNTRHQLEIFRDLRTGDVVAAAPEEEKGPTAGKRKRGK